MTELFIPIASATEIELGSTKHFAAETTPIVIANIDGEFVAFASNCACLSHFSGYRRDPGETTLADGELVGSLLTCPVHGTVYDLRDGHPVKGPGEVSINTYEVKNYRGELRVATMTDSERRFWNAA